MSLPASPVQSPQQQQQSPFFDLVDLDFNDPPSPDPPGDTTKSPPNKASRWAPMVPDTKVVTPTLGAASLEESDEEEQEVEEHEVEVESASVVSGNPSPLAVHDEAETKAAKTPTAAPASDSGDSSAHLRAAATPFTSKSLRVAPASAPHSFFPDRADTASHVTVPLPTSPYAGQERPDAARSNSGAPGFFYGESDGYAGDGSTTVPVTWSHSPPSPAVGLSPVAAAAFRPPPESKPIRISSPQQITITSATAKPSPLTPKTNPLPESEPARIPLPQSGPSAPTPLPSSPITSPGKRPLDLLSGDDDSDVSHGNPVNGLIRSMSNFSLQAEPREPEPITVEEDASSVPSSNGPQTPAKTSDAMPSEHAQQTLEGLLESLEELDEMEKQWADYRDAYGKFSGGIEEVIARLRYNLDGHTCANHDQNDDLRASRQQILTLQTELRELKSAKITKERGDKARADDLASLQQQLADKIESCTTLEKAASEAKVKEEAAWSKLERLREKYDTLEADRLHWHKREVELGKSFLDLEDQYERTITELGRMKQRVAAVEAAPAVKVPSAVFGAVLIECTATVIDKEFIKRGAGGGKELGENILAAVMPREEGLVIAQIFLNFPDLKKKLIQSNVIKREADLHDFLDGFRSVSGLFTVVDTESPTAKVQDHLKLYKLLGATKIIMSSRRSSPYRDVIEALSASDRKGVYSVRGGGSPDPFDFLGDQQFVSISGLMDAGSAPQLDRTPQATPIPRPATPPTVSTAAPPQRSRTPPHLRPTIPIPDSATSLVSPTSTIPPTPTELPRAPWAQAPKPETKPRPTLSPTVSRKPAAGVPWWQAGDTMNDAVQPAAASGDRRSSVSSAGQMSPPGTPRAVQGARTRGGGLTVKVPDLASLAGSPPDSDEDHPNVDLPHSAVKWVQRPIEFSQDSAGQTERSRSASVTSSSVGGGSRAGVGKIHPSRAFQLAQDGLGLQGGGPRGASPRNTSKTGANDIPLGSGGGGTRGKLHGFNVRK